MDVIEAVEGSEDHADVQENDDANAAGDLGKLFCDKKALWSRTALVFVVLEPTREASSQKSSEWK